MQAKTSACGLIKTGLAALALLCYMLVNPVGAQASTASLDATGGGCSSFVYFAYGYFNVCIGAPSPGYAQADIYVHWNGVPNRVCSVFVEDAISSGTGIGGTSSFLPCTPSGTQRVYAGAVHNNNRSYY